MLSIGLVQLTIFLVKRYFDMADIVEYTFEQKAAPGVTTSVQPVSPSAIDGRANTPKERTTTPLSGAKVCLAFSLAFFPMLTIPALLLALVTVGKVPHFTSEGTETLTTFNAAPSGNYYVTTGISAGKFALVASWASTIMSNISAPFLILFSFLIARSMSRMEEYGTDRKSKERIREILHSRSYIRLLKWIRTILPWNNEERIDQASYVTIAGFGFTLVYT